jgi:hypothetical protein
MKTLQEYKDTLKAPTADFEYEYFKKVKGNDNVQREDNSKARSNEAALRGTR